MSDKNRGDAATDGEPIGLDEIGEDKADTASTEKAIELPIEDGDANGQPS